MNIVESLTLWRFWCFKAVLAFRLKYRGSALGSIWPVASVSIAVLVIGTVWGILLEREDLPAYYLYLTCGYSVWMFQAGAIEQGCRDLSSKSFGGVPFFTIVLERLVTAAIPFGLTLPIVLFALVLLGQPQLTSIYQFPITLFFLTIWSVGVITLLISLISVAPDLRHLINAMMRLAFLATPIIWEVERLGPYAKYIWINPFYLPLDSCRQSLTGSVDERQFVILAVYSFLMMAFGMIMLRIRMKEIVK